MRSGTLDTPSIAGFAAAAAESSSTGRGGSHGSLTLRDELIARVLAEVPDATLNGDPRLDVAPPTARQRAPVVPRVRGRLAAHAAGRPRRPLLDRLGLLGRSGRAEPRVAGDGVATPAEARSSLRFSLGHTSTRADVDELVAAIGPVVERARAARSSASTSRQASVADAGPCCPVRWRRLSGGRCRVRDAGHDVTAVHLALSSNPQTFRSGARGCCSLEDSRDARRVADVLGLPYYVWDLAEQFRAEVVDDFLAEYAAGRTPNPCLRCNERIKFAAVLDRALALGFDAVCTGHYAQVVGGPDGPELHRAVDADKDQSYVLAVLGRDQIAHSLFPLGDSPKSQVRAEAAERGLLVADKPDSHDICFIADGDTQGFLAVAPGRAARSDRDRDGAVLGEHEGAYAFTVGQREGSRAHGRDPRPQPALRPVDRAGDQHRHGRAAGGSPGARDRRRASTLVRADGRLTGRGCRCSTELTARSSSGSVGERAVVVAELDRAAARCRAGPDAWPCTTARGCCGSATITAAA